MNCARTQVLLLSLLTVACGPGAAPSEKIVQPGSGTPGAGVTPVGSSKTGKKTGDPKPGVRSIYTDLAEDTCVDDESSDNEGWSVRSCRGIDGYRLLVGEGDMRQSADVVTPDGKRFELELPVVVSSAFSTVGDKAEWRLARDNGTNRPIALIIRYNVNTDPNDTEKITSYLTVSKISPNAACVTDVVKPKPNANAAARRPADTA